MLNINWKELDNSFSREMFDGDFCPRSLGNLKAYFKSPPSPPAAPDPAAIAAAQGSANKETSITQANLNAVNEFNPLGSRVFESFTDPVSGEPRFRATTELNPTAQAAFEAEQNVTRGTNELASGQIGRIEDAVAQPFSFGGLPAAPEANDEARRRVEDSLFARNLRFLEPRFEQEERDIDTQLANQGIVRDSDAFRREKGNFNLRKDATFADARDQAVVGGGAEQTRTFGLESAARDRGVQERSFERNIPLNEIGALLGTGQVNIPTFTPPPQTGVSPTDVVGAHALAAQVANNNFRTQSGSANAFNQGLFNFGGQLGGGFLGRPSSPPTPSDRRLKTNIRKIGQLANGLFIYVYNYIWGGQLQVGVMADEVKKIMPHAVVNIDGFDAVYYEEVIRD